MGSLQFPNMGMGLRLAAFDRRNSAIMYRLYSATLLKDPAALYNKSDINIKSIE